MHYIPLVDSFAHEGSVFLEAVQSDGCVGRDHRKTLACSDLFMTECLNALYPAPMILHIDDDTVSLGAVYVGSHKREEKSTAAADSQIARKLRRTNMADESGPQHDIHGQLEHPKAITRAKMRFPSHVVENHFHQPWVCNLALVKNRSAPMPGTRLKHQVLA